MNTTIGLEVEIPLIHESGRAPNQEEMNTLWQTLADKDWKLKKDVHTDALLGVSRETSFGTLAVDTDGGLSLIEIALPPVEKIEQAAELFQETIRTITSTLGPAFMLLGTGHPPFLDPRDVQISPKSYYKTLIRITDDITSFRPFYSAASTQVNIGGKSLVELFDAMNAFLALAGPLFALSSNTPVFLGKKTGHKEYRGVFYDDLQSHFLPPYEQFTNLPDEPYKDVMSYVRALFSRRGHMLFFDGGFWKVLDDTPLLDALREQKEMRFEEIMIPGREPKQITKVLDIQDCGIVQALAWFDTRLKFAFKEDVTTEQFLEAIDNDDSAQFESLLANRYIEIRPMSTQRAEDTFAMPAFCIGLFQQADEVKNIVESHSWEFWKKMRVAGYKDGMSASVDGVHVADILSPLLELAQKGLDARGGNESWFAQDLADRIEHKRSPADAIEAMFDENKDALHDMLRIIADKLTWQKK